MNLNDSINGTHSNAGTSLLKVSAFFLSFPITDEYSMLMHQTQPNANMLVNKQALVVLSFFKTSRPISELPDADDREAAQFLSDHGFLVNAEVVESGEAQTEPDELSIWLHVTGSCNFRCSYCYLPHPDEHMSLETGKACIEKAFEVARKKNFSKLQIKYSGGEPLLQFPFVIELHHFANELAQATGIGLSEIVLSNGSLLNKTIIDSLQENEIALMVSLDSLGSVYNPQRVWGGGATTAEWVTKKIELALENDLKPQISVTVSAANIASLPDLLDWLLDHGLVFSLNFYRDNSFATREKGELAFSDEEIIHGLKEAYKRIEEKLPDWNLLASLVDRSNLSVPHQFPCGVGQNYLVFDQFGHISSCHMDMEHQLAKTTDDDPLRMIQASVLGVKNIPIEKRLDCRDCPWRNWCAGGCPYLTQRIYGTSTFRSPYCRIYQAIFPEIIRLEGLRLIRQVEG